MAALDRAEPLANPARRWKGELSMRTLRVSLVGTVILMLLGGLGGAVVAQDEVEEPTAVRVTVTQECAGRSTCIWTHGDPRLPDTLTTEMFTGSVEVPGAGFLDAGFAWMEQSSEGPDGGWTGYVYALWGEPTQNFLVLSGTGANEGWHYIASGTDPDTDGDFEWLGTLYAGELPPFPEAAVAGGPAEEHEEVTAGRSSATELSE